MKIAHNFYRIIASTGILAIIALAVPQTASAVAINLCLSLNHSECIVAHGAGNNVTIQGSGYNAWTPHDAGTIGGNHVFYFTNGSGNCLKANANGNVIASSASCAGDDLGWWEQTADTPLRYKNVANGKYMGTWGDASGNNVYTRDQQTGFWSGWFFN